MERGLERDYGSEGVRRVEKVQLMTPRFFPEKIGGFLNYFLLKSSKNIKA